MERVFSCSPAVADLKFGALHWCQTSTLNWFQKGEGMFHYSSLCNAHSRFYMQLKGINIKQSYQSDLRSHQLSAR